MGVGVGGELRVVVFPKRSVDWLFWIYGPFRKYFILYRVVYQKNGERKEK